MDTNACYFDIMLAIECGDRERASELAELLRAGIVSDDDYPDDYSLDEVDANLAGILQTPDSRPFDDAVPFSLVCVDCDAGMDMPNLAAALAAGWQAIELCPDLPQANYLGLCPECVDAEQDDD